MREGRVPRDRRGASISYNQVVAADLAQLVPWLDAGSAVQITGGWTAETYALDGGWIVQIARTSYAANTLRHQLRVLPKLFPHFGAKIPKPQLVCDGPVVVVYRKLDGVPCDRVPGAWPEQLGGFLDRLHSLAPASLGVEKLDAGTLRDDLRLDCKRLHAAVAPHLVGGEQLRAEMLLADLLDDDRIWKFHPVVAHNDLGPEHVLVTGDGDLVGVIDWEEVGTGDPATDFAWWLHAMPEVGQRMLTAYSGEIDPQFRERTRLLYALMPWDEVEHGAAVGDRAMVASGLAGLRARLG
jgi:aminoglycoside phosphotransferase (APT) family kinase protein